MRWEQKPLRCFLRAGLLLAVTACSTLPAQVVRVPSQALEAPRTTSLGRQFRPDDGGNSGFLPLLSGSRAWQVRAAMSGLAERTLDLQYYIWEDDVTGRLLLHEVLHAAERGVRVRILLDDVHTEGETDMFHVVDAHPNVQVRLFNPFPRNEVRLSGLLLEGSHLNRRMHNKVMIADNAIAVTGGRNIGDHYFAVDESTNFRDLDLVAAGPVVGRLSFMFDTYWNSRWAYPIEALGDESHSPQRAARYRQFLENLVRQPGQHPFEPHESRSARTGLLDRVQANLVHGEARVVFDEPEKVSGRGDHAVAEMLFDATSGVQRELLIETAYFIPGDSGVEILASLVERGVSVKVLTNSLATNDIKAAHAGYAPFRAPLIRAGVEVHELRPDALRDSPSRLFNGLSRATLHTKALVYDREGVLLGSFNLDPRSLALNTEIGVHIESAELAARIAGIIESGMHPKNSYRLALDSGDLVWLRRDGNDVVRLDHEPETGWWERFVTSVLALLPIKSQL